MAILDTTFLVDLQHGEDAAQAALHALADGPERLVVPAQAAIEYLAGMKDPVAGLTDIERSFELVPLVRENILEAARLGRQGLQEGSFQGWADTQIVATAQLMGAEVVTADPDDFRAYGCETWDYRNEVRSPGSASD
jgi:predicted nucleic acid-binding protein